MPRPPLRRWVTGVPRTTYFKPQGLPVREIEELCLPVEGLEALRLADLEGLTTEAAALRMGVSRHTFGRVLTEARALVARALVSGAALRIEGGHYEVLGDGCGLANRSEAPDVPAMLPKEDTVMRQGNGGQAGRGQGRCGQGQGQGQGQGRGGGGRCGQGMGQGGGRQAMAAGRCGSLPGQGRVDQVEAAMCRCPQCGQTVPHTPGTSCGAMHCPSCGAAMIRA